MIKIENQGENYGHRNGDFIVNHRFRVFGKRRGLVCGRRGGDCGKIAEKLRVPQLVIGLTIVAFGTSAPELATSIISAVQGDVGIAIGNIVGSNITNVLLILGLAAIIANLPVHKDTLRIDFPVLIGSSALLLLCGLNGTLERWEGVLLFVISVVSSLLCSTCCLRRRIMQMLLNVPRILQLSLLLPRMLCNMQL